MGRAHALLLSALCHSQSYSQSHSQYFLKAGYPRRTGLGARRKASSCFQLDDVTAREHEFPSGDRVLAAHHRSADAAAAAAADWR
jgi:hypothetical protein